MKLRSGFVYLSFRSNSGMVYVRFRSGKDQLQARFKTSTGLFQIKFTSSSGDGGNYAQYWYLEIEKSDFRNREDLPYLRISENFLFSSHVRFRSVSDQVQGWLRSGNT